MGCNGTKPKTALLSSVYQLTLLWSYPPSTSLSLSLPPHPERRFLAEAVDGWRAPIFMAPCILRAATFPPLALYTHTTLNAPPSSIYNRFVTWNVPLEIIIVNRLPPPLYITLYKYWRNGKKEKEERRGEGTWKENEGRDGEGEKFNG